MNAHLKIGVIITRINEIQYNDCAKDYLPTLGTINELFLVCAGLRFFPALTETLEKSLSPSGAGRAVTFHLRETLF